MEDAAAIAEMEHQIFSDAWSEKSVLDTMNQKNAVCLTAEKAGRIIGYVLSYTAADEAEIARIAVAEEFRRQGTARAILRELENVCSSKGVKKLLLDVRDSNREARAFYTDMGFQEDGIRRRFYENPQEDGILMSRELRS